MTAYKDAFPAKGLSQVFSSLKWPVSILRRVVQASKAAALLDAMVSPRQYLMAVGCSSPTAFLRVGVVTGFMMSAGESTRGAVTRLGSGLASALAMVSDGASGMTLLRGCMVAAGGATAAMTTVVAGLVSVGNSTGCAGTISNASARIMLKITSVETRP